MAEEWGTNDNSAYEIVEMGHTIDNSVNILHLIVAVIKFFKPTVQSLKIETKRGIISHTSRDRLTRTQ